MSRTGHFKYWTLSDGQSVRVEDVMEKTGLSYTGSTSRLKRFSKPEDVLAPRMQQGIPKGTKLESVEWTSEPTQVVGGIQWLAEWEDGKIITVSGPVYDRYGDIISSREHHALIKYREKLRQEWRDNNNIINREVNDD
jgi:hypothetical protein